MPPVVILHSTFREPANYCTMPPVARTATTPWGKAIDAALKRNVERGKGPETLGQLQRALSQSSSPTEASWKKTIYSIRTGSLGVTQRMAELIAGALEVSLSQLPPADQRASAAETRDRLRVLEEEVPELIGAVAALLEIVAILCESVEALGGSAPTEDELEALRKRFGALTR